MDRYLTLDSWAQTAAPDQSVNVAIIYMTTHKLANNIDCLLEAEWPDGFSKHRNTDHINSRWRDR